MSIDADGVDLVLANRKGRALLAYLALNARPTERRERLAGLLWSEASEPHARASLRQVLADIRTAIKSAGGNVIIADRNDVALAAAVEVDWTAMMREIEAGRVPEILISCPRAAETVLAGYEDLSPLFREWVVALRARIQERLIYGLEEGYKKETLPTRARRVLAEAVLRLDPAHEDACRTVMRLAAEEGEIGPALRAYAELYETLVDELDMEPSAPTQALVAEIKKGDFEHTKPPKVFAPPRSRSGVPVVAVLPFRPIGPDPVPRFLPRVSLTTPCAY
ncbi:MAG: hypothetical protein JO204_16910 [Alphaproteobacteria bacterium]|nr:hypothetical protein [Alphaproteobacteria bacterium]